MNDKLRELLDKIDGHSLSAALNLVYSKISESYREHSLDQARFNELSNLIEPLNNKELKTLAEKIIDKKQDFDKENLPTLSTFKEQSEINSRAKCLTLAFAVFCQTCGLDKKRYALDSAILNDVCERYYRDRNRLRQSHPPMDRIDRHKISGYTSYWLCKLKPIKIVGAEEEIQAEYKSHVVLKSSDGTEDSAILRINDALAVNEKFALFVSCGRLHNAGSKLSENVYIPLLYNLRYRPTSGDALSLIYYLAEVIFKDTPDDSRLLPTTPE
ncbi:MAG: hypothetical protein FWD35_05105 [Oscillospiraceae bacterium]|nr:hypothetical protein [Oscillospiraceae bacterium]